MSTINLRPTPMSELLATWTPRPVLAHLLGFTSCNMYAIDGLCYYCVYGNGPWSDWPPRAFGHTKFRIHPFLLVRVPVAEESWEGRFYQLPGFLAGF